VTRLPDQIEIEVGGRRVTVHSIDKKLQHGGSVARVAIVGHTVDELLTVDAYTYAYQTLLDSAHRRDLSPAGAWMVGFLPVDWPQWRECLVAEIGDRVAAKLAEINGHVVVFALMDSADIVFDE